MSRLFAYRDPRKAFADNLALVLEARGITNRELAETLDRTDEGIISRWKTGKQFPNGPEELVELGSVLDLPFYALLIPRPPLELAIKALKVAHGDEQEARTLSHATARTILAETAFWTSLGLGDRSTRTLKRAELEALIDVSHAVERRSPGSNSGSAPGE